ncbi:MAG: biotin transporter BioY [Candidatus Cloacimonetes bacterium]|nr:biotin transporter BioY [Candidatus Cloacimonadota bacterium]
MNQSLRWKILAALLSSLIVLSTQFQIMVFGAVPFTLQTVAIQIGAFALPKPYGIISIILYLMLGLIGFPVFSKGGAGIGHFLGPTGGFLYGFLIATILIQIFRLQFLKSRFHLFLGIAIHTIVLFSFGEIHLSYVTGKDLYTVFTSIMLAFYPFAIIKCFISLFAVETLIKAILRKGMDPSLKSCYLNKAL